MFPLSTRCSASIFVFLHDPDTDILSTGIQLPYSCITNESASHAFTYVVRVRTDDSSAASCGGEIFPTPRCFFGECAVRNLLMNDRQVL